MGCINLKVQYAAGIAGPNKKIGNLQKSVKRNKYLLLIFLPGLLFFIVFEYLPMFGVIVAFQDFSVHKGVFGSKWVGLEHFITFFKSPYFFRLLRNTILINLYGLVFMFPIPIVLALLLNELRNTKFKKLVQTLTFLPYMISTTVIISILVSLLSPTTGVINTLIQRVFGIEKIYFLGEPQYFRSLYVFTEIWQKTGYQAVIFIAALASIDSQLYEACIVDGGGRFRQLWHITLPGISTTIVLLLIINIGKLLNVGAEKVILMYNPLIYETADVFKSYVYRIGVMGANFSIGAAVDFFNNTVGILLLVIANYISRRVTESSLW